MAAPGPCTQRRVARELGITRVLIPRAPGHFSACGMLFSDLRYDYVQTRFTKLAELNFGESSKSFDQLETKGRDAIAQTPRAHANGARRTLTRYALCRPGTSCHHGCAPSSVS